MKRVWVSARIAKRWREGSTVVEKRVYDFGSRYKIHSWFRPDWLLKPDGIPKAEAGRLYFMKIDGRTYDRR